MSTQNGNVFGQFSNAFKNLGEKLGLCQSGVLPPPRRGEVFTEGTLGTKTMDGQDVVLALEKNSPASLGEIANLDGDQAASLFFENQPFWGNIQSGIVAIATCCNDAITKYGKASTSEGAKVRESIWNFGANAVVLLSFVNIFSFARYMSYAVFAIVEGTAIAADQVDACLSLGAKDVTRLIEYSSSSVIESLKLSKKQQQILQKLISGDIKITEDDIIVFIKETDWAKGPDQNSSVWVAIAFFSALVTAASSEFEFISVIFSLIKGRFTSTSTTFQPLDLNTSGVSDDQQRSAEVTNGIISAY